LTGREGSLDVDGAVVAGFEVAGFDVAGFEVSCLAGVFSAGLLELFAVTLDFGRLLLGLVAAPELAGFSFGRDVRNAPRTSSSCKTGAAIPMRNTLRQTNAKIMTLNRIYQSPC
jgi:hypothetical protein